MALRITSSYVNSASSTRISSGWWSPSPKWWCWRPAAGSRSSVSNTTTTLKGAPRSVTNRPEPVLLTKSQPGRARLGLAAPQEVGRPSRERRLKNTSRTQNFPCFTPAISKGTLWTPDSFPRCPAGVTNALICPTSMMTSSSLPSPPRGPGEQNSPASSGDKTIKSSGWEKQKNLGLQPLPHTVKT